MGRPESVKCDKYRQNNDLATWNGDCSPTRRCTLSHAYGRLTEKMSLGSIALISC
jgi:hypothetical protein